MYLKSKTVCAAFEKLELISNRDTSGKLRRERTSALKYFFSTAELITKNGIDFIDLSVREDVNRREFISAAGNVVRLNDSNKYTNNFYDEIEEKPDFAVGSNFLTTTTKRNRNYPGRPSPLLTIEDAKVRLYDEYQNSLFEFGEFNSYRIYLAIWLLRFEVFKKEQLPSEQVIQILKNKYGEEIQKILIKNISELKSIDLQLQQEQVLDFSHCVTHTKSEKISYFSVSERPTNKIFYGCPGTGKSYKLNQILNNIPKEQQNRITFHPDFDYASFVGGYKPISVKGDDDKYDIQYKFVAQAFAKIYVEAWKNIENENKYFLAIEEINRGNCAEIFGDIFQLLDRDANYTVTPSDEFQKYLEEELGAEHDGLKNGLKLPSNLYIYATMNTSDQSLFPMDSAFKRRWDWEYIPICYDETTEEGKPNPSYSYKVQLDDNKSFSWNDFISKINIEHIQDEPTLGMDKCIGNYFIKPNVEGVITLEAFINKVLFYLWNDVFKDEKNEVFLEKEAYESYFPIKTRGLEKLIALLKRINVEIIEQPQNAQEEQQDEAIN